MSSRSVMTQIVGLGLAVVLAPLALPSATGFDLASSSSSADADSRPPHASGVDPQLLQMSQGIDAAQAEVDAYLVAKAAEEVAVREYLAAVEAERVAVEEAAAHRARVQAYVRGASQGPSPWDDAAWDALAQCETGGNWSMRGSRYSGGVGFYNGTWDSFGGREFAGNAGAASREQQIEVGRRVQARHGWSAWGCARTLGWTR